MVMRDVEDRLGERFERYADEVRVCETSRARGRELIAMSRAMLIIVSATSVSVILNTVEDSARSIDVYVGTNIL